jgi:hypothetical protein
MNTNSEEPKESFQADRYIVALRCSEKTTHSNSVSFVPIRVHSWFK